MVIVTDLDLVREDDRRGARMYIALTRALTAARIVASRRVLADDPVLKRFL